MIKSDSKEALSQKQYYLIWLFALSVGSFLGAISFPLDDLKSPFLIVSLVSSCIAAFLGRSLEPDHSTPRASSDSQISRGEGVEWRHKNSTQTTGIERYISAAASGWGAFVFSYSLLILAINGFK